ncbi:divergent polysaccharide deacetylase family protein [Magnetovibrio sp.]|uniref:divergent polysaccharide deacetylase family protein n=1 Tax=Magnetovibrio sp. TaxID=2024836 RepID=UPI002F952153
MKLPLINKLSAVTGVFARLNPMGLIAKLKSRKKGGDDEEDDDRDFRPSGSDGDDLFADLGDLDELDAEAREKAEEDGEGDFDDFDNKELDEFDEHEFDHQEGDEHDPFDDQALDLDEADETSADSASDQVMKDLADFDIGDGFDDDDEEDDEEEAQKAKLKKLGILAGGGVAIAMVIGGLSWWLLGGDAGPQSTEDVAAGTHAPVPDGAGGLVLNLDDFAPAPVPETAAPALSAPGSTAPNFGASAPEMPATTGVESATAMPVEGMSSAGDGAPQSELGRLGLDVQMEPGVGVVIPSTTKASYENLTPWPAAEPLQPAPLDTLVEPSEHGLLPKIDVEGNTPYDAYARPEPQTKSGDPKIAIIVTGLGMSRATTEAAISITPADVALSMDVYARGLDFWVKRARTAGHEVLLNMPSESSDFPFSDPGPSALKALATPDENIKKLEWILSQTTGYFGVLSVYGSKFLTVEEQLKTVIEALKKRGLMYVDGGMEDSLGSRVAYQVGAKWATVDLTLDANPGRTALDLQLQELEALAKKRAIAIARVSASPLALERLTTWLKTLDQKGLQLVPVSSLANKQLIR